MNILYCGDENIKDGLLLSILSLLKYGDWDFNFYVFTMQYENHKPISKGYIKKIEKIIKEKNKNNKIFLIDITDYFKKEEPTINLETRFTPYCMLRLYADLVDIIPDKILYLDTDVLCHASPLEFWKQEFDDYEVLGVLDHYGKWFFQRKKLKFCYINSGVLLINMRLIRKNKTFKKCRELCQNKKMFFPDQKALNKYAKIKLMSTKYNEQVKTRNDTVFRHFTTRFPFFIKSISSIKPWNIDKLHKILKDYQFDDIINEYLKIKEKMNNE